MRTMLMFFRACSAHPRTAQQGATLIEYVLIVAVIAIAIFAAAQFGLADAIEGVFEDATDTLNNAGADQ